MATDAVLLLIAVHRSCAAYCAVVVTVQAAQEGYYSGRFKLDSLALFSSFFPLLLCTVRSDLHNLSRESEL